MEIEIDSVDIDTDEWLEELADIYAANMEHGELECPADDCESETFDVELWATDRGGLDGAAVCRECNSRIELDIDDSDLKESLNEIEEAFENLF